MRKTADDSPVTFRDAEALFRTKPISEIRNVEATTKHQIAQKQEELRQLVGNRYRDLIDSADSIVLMKFSSHSISRNFSLIDAAIRSLAPTHTPKLINNPVRSDLYSIATRVKYLVDTPENIWGCLDESMFLEASRRYLRAKLVHHLLVNRNSDREFLSNFPLLNHQWQIVESFRFQISQRARDRLMDRGPGVAAYADALTAVVTIDELGPDQTLTLFLDSRRSWITQKLSASSSLMDGAESVSDIFCDAVRIIQASLGQVGELFLQVLNDMPLFYKTVLESPPGTQLFGGIPNPDEEVRLWKSHRENLESSMSMLVPEIVLQKCTSWLQNYAIDIVSRVNGKYLVDVIQSGEQLGNVEKLIRGTMGSREAVEGSLEWLRSVFGSEVESPWNRICELVLREDYDLWDGIFEEAFVRRMKDIIDSGFIALSNAVNLRETIGAIGAGVGDMSDFSSYFKKGSIGGGVWFLEPRGKRAAPGYGFKATTDEADFKSCLNAYFGVDVSRVRDLVDSKCQSILEDLIYFFGSPKSAHRLRELAPYLQDKCYNCISAIMKELEGELSNLSSALVDRIEEHKSQPPAIIVERSLFIGRLLFAMRNHSTYIPLILGSPRLWLGIETRSDLSNRSPLTSRQSLAVGFDSPKPNNSLKRQSFDSPRRQSSSAVTTTLFGVEDIAYPKLEELSMALRELCIKAHSLWITWVCDEVSVILAKDLEKDDALSATTPLRGWEETIIKQEQSNEGALEIKIALPFMPSLYVTCFLFHVCQEIHKIGGHVLDKFILQNIAYILLEKVLGIYSDFISSLDSRTPQVSEKGILQILLDLQFIVDILSGGKDLSSSGSNSDLKDLPKGVLAKSPYKRKLTQFQPSSPRRERVKGLVNSLSQRLDPIDWATFESYLWDNEKQSYQRHAVLFGFLVQLNRMHTDIVQKLPTNTESNIMRCSTVPRFKYLPISAPVLSSRGPTQSALSASDDDVSSRSSWKAYSSGELSPKLGFDDSSSFRVATPLLKSFMTQVGNKFGESTFKLGSMLTESQVGRLKEKSVMSTFGDMLPVQAAGLLSSFTAGAGRSDP